MSVGLNISLTLGLTLKLVHYNVTGNGKRDSAKAEKSYEMIIS